MNWQDVPVYITNYNNLETGFRTTVNWFLNLGMKVTVFDNKSSYPPLLEYYSKLPYGVTLVNVGYNSGVWGFWQAKLNTEERTATHYITTDSDCPPDDICPKDLVEKMVSVLDAYPDIRKVSPGIRLDNLPDCYNRKADAIGCQTSLPWTPAEDRGLGLKLFHTYTDTTMTMWRGGYRAPGRCSIADDNGGETPDMSLRIDTPYVLKHVPWYANSACPTAESLFYRQLKDKVNGPVFGM
jgi:hypothetical protein